MRLAYNRQADGVTSMHEVAPIDIRPGWTPRIQHLVYLWAWCFAESKAEMHLLERVEFAIPLSEKFDAAAILQSWKESAWPLPDEWFVPRDW